MFSHTKWNVNQNKIGMKDFKILLTVFLRKSVLLTNNGAFSG